MSDIPERDKLVKRLEGAKNFHFSWGPDADKLTPEERAKHINEVMDAIQHEIENPDWKAFGAEPSTNLVEANQRIGWMLRDIKIAYDAMHLAMNVLNVDVLNDTPFPVTDEEKAKDKLRGDAFCALDMGCVHLGNHYRARKLKKEQRT